jgi:hypothetical protein
MLHSGLTRTQWTSLKMIASDTHSSLLVQRALEEEKSFITSTPALPSVDEVRYL